MEKRYGELDSLRGLAALTVLVGHFLEILPVMASNTYGKMNMVNILKYTPLHLFWSGGQAVMFFFVLSGFVLSLPFYKNKPFSYRSFIAKRVCRIYIPYIISIVMAITLSIFLSRGGIKNLSSWFNEIWTRPITAFDILNHILFIPSYANNRINPVIWSLIHEMRISLVFPLIMILVKRLDWIKNLIWSISLAFLGMVLAFVFKHYLSIDTDYFNTLIYIYMFVIGALLAKNREFLISKIIILTRIQKILLLILALFLYSYEWWPLYGNKIIHIGYFNEFVTVIGASIIIILSLSTRKLSNLLLLKPVHFLGKSSYSIYLFHALVLIAAINVLYGRLPVWNIWIIALVLSLAVSTLMYYLIEIPSMKLGRKMSNS